MASLSFRDRFFSPPVAHALTSPSGILALGAGAAVGIVATAPVSVPLAAVGAVVGGVVGLGVRVAFALPRRSGGTTERMDPFSVNEPWRHAVIDAVRARGRFTQALKGFQAGPLRDTMTSVGDRLDEAVEECWRIARQGQRLADARRTIDDRQTRWELQQARAAGPVGPSDTRARTIAALEAQLGTAARLDALIASTKEQLDLLNARLDESVTRAIELSVSNQDGGMGALGDDVGAIVDDLEALRMAMEDVDRTGPAEPGATEPGTTAGAGLAAPGPAASSAAAPPPPPPPPPPAGPPPLPDTEGRSQASPGT